MATIRVAISVVLLLSCNFTHAAVLLTVATSVPAAVTITSTTATPLGNNNADTNGAGIVLQSFVESDSVAYNSFTDIASSDLAASGVTEAYNHVNLDGPRSFNLFFSEEQTLQTFDTSTRAFTGSIVIDMTNSEYGDLPSCGVSASIVSGDDAVGMSPVLGNWSTPDCSAAPSVPVPTLPVALLFFLSGLLALLGLTRVRIPN